MQAVPLQLLYEWYYIDYIWPNPLARISAINLGQYNHTKAYLCDALFTIDDRLLVTVVGPEGVPFSLNLVSDKTGDGGPLLLPYPDWTWGRRTDCKGIIEATRLVIDQCNRLWVLDSGKIINQRVCPAQLIAFDLTFNIPVYQRTIPDDIASGTSGNGQLDSFIIVNDLNPCLFIDQTVIYLTDASGYAMVVCTFLGCRRITSDSFLPTPAAELVTVAGQSYVINDGVNNLLQVGSTIYLTVQASYNLLSIQQWQVGVALISGTIQPEIFLNIANTQISGIILSQTGAIFVGLVGETAIGCLNSQQIQNVTVVLQDQENLQLITNLNIRYVNADEYLYGVSNRGQRYATHTMNFAETNFRIFQIETAALLGPSHGGSVCVNAEPFIFK